ncbi:MAG: hypothetical protein GX660_18930 [Clostridiaceae bacterium]|nr:hypothetical protein [Clostridiaceae bacterium]
MKNEYIFTIVDDGFEEVAIESVDFINNKYIIDSNDGRLKINGNAYYSIPSSSLSTYFKGGLGEHMYCNLLNLNCTDAEDFYHLTGRCCTYDIINCSETEKIDVKASFQKGYTKSFMHFLATNKPGNNGVKISETKYKKNYQAEGIKTVVCVDFFNDSSILPNIYEIPSDSNEVRNYSTISIPYSGKTVYNKYKKDISNIIKNQ